MQKFVLHISSITLFVCAAFFNGSAQSNVNALKGDLFVHDPVMIKSDSNYYIFSTGKGISVKASPDGINWTKAGRVFADSLAWWKNDIPNQDGHIWAPDIHYRDGQYHLYYSVSAWMNFNSSIGYATNVTLNPKDPNFKWVDKGMVINYQNGGDGVNVIDPNVFTDSDGSVWLFYGSYKTGLRVTELNCETGMLMTNPPDITTLTTSLGEGVFVIKYNEYYYIFASRGICCKGMESNYQVVMGRSKNLKGPYLNKLGESWIDNKYTLFLKGDESEPGRGHNGFYSGNDTTFIVYHAYTRSADGKSLLNIKPVYVDEDGWPTMQPTDRVLNAIVTFAK